MVEIKVKIDGVEYSQEQLKGLAEGAKDAAKETKDLGKETKKAAEEGTALGMLKGKISGIISPLKGVVAGFKTLKGALISTGIGALVVALGSLVSYFTTTEEGSKKLAIATEALSILWGKFTEQAAKLGEALINAFNNPKEALKDFGRLLVNQVVERVKSALEVVGYLGIALGKVFKGDFAGAKEAVVEAGKEMVDVLTGVDDSTEKIAETSKKVFKEVKKAVEEAVVTATELVDRTRALRDQQQELIVANAELNKELETQQRIAEDTTRAYDERKEALIKAGEAQVKLAENVAAQAKNEEALLKLQIENANSYKEKEELETQLAEATASRIDAETALETKRLEQAKITIELDQEELDRKRTIKDTIDGLNAETIENQRQAALEQLQIAEDAAIAELTLLRATEEEKQQVRNAYAKIRASVNADADQQERDNAQAVFGQLASNLEEGTAAYKAAKIAETTIATYSTAIKAYDNALDVPFIGNVLAPIAAGAAIAAGLKTVQQITQTQVPEFAYGGMISGASHSAGGQLIEAEGGEYVINKYAMRQPGVADIAESLNNTANPSSSGSGMAIKTYVVAADITNAQEANTKIKNLSRL